MSLYLELNYRYFSEGTCKGEIPLCKAAVDSFPVSGWVAGGVLL